MGVDSTKSDSNDNAGAEGQQDSAKAAPDQVRSDRDGASGGEKPGDRRAWSTTLGVLGFVAALGVGFYAGKWLTGVRGASVEVEAGPRYRVDLRGDEPQKGPDDALVTVIEFADFECPYCAQGSDTLMEAAESFEDDVRVIFKHYPLPFHERAIPAARAAWVAHQYDKFWPFHDYLYERRGDLSEVLDHAQSLGIAPDEFSAKLSSREAAQAVDDDRKAGAKLKITGTPAYFVNGHMYSGALSERGWKQVLEAEQEIAEDLEDAGTPRDQVYEALMARARELRELPTAEVPTAEVPTPEAGNSAAAPTRAAGEPKVGVTYKIPTDDRPSLGPDDALVTIVVFSDFQCPYCARLAPTLHEVVNRHDDVRVVYRNMPVPKHAEAEPAAKAALAAHRQGKFWEMHDRLFAKDASLTEEGLIAAATEVGLDMDQFQEDRKDPVLDTLIEEDRQVALGVGVISTPTCFINGRYVRGAQTADSLDGVIKDARARAEAALERGVDRSQVYAALMENAVDVDDG